MSTTHADRNRTMPPPPPVGDPLLGRPAGITRTAPRPGPRPPAAASATRTPGKRRHPAKGSRAAALVMSIGSTAGLTAYFYQADSSAASGTGAASTATALQPSVVVAPATPAAGAPQVTAATTPATAAATVATVAPAAPASTAAVAPATNALADGTFIGQTFTNRWGPVQVQVTVSSGQITDVATLQSPGGRSRSIQISNIATPILRTEALQAQSTQIHTVSGATYTSKGYRQSLQSALDVAKAQATANAG